jgi:hypothetical protein
MHYDVKKVDKPPKKPTKLIDDQFIYIKKDDDMFLTLPMPDDAPIMQTQPQEARPIAQTLELPPEIDQFQALMKITKDNTPLALIILIVLMFQKMNKKQQEDKDHALVCDFERHEIEKKINTLEAKINEQARQATKIQLGDDELVDRVDQLEAKLKKMQH